MKNPKFEIRNPKYQARGGQYFRGRVQFGFSSDFGFRISSFEFRIF